MTSQLGYDIQGIGFDEQLGETKIQRHLYSFQHCTGFGFINRGISKPEKRGRHHDMAGEVSDNHSETDSFAIRIKSSINVHLIGSFFRRFPGLLTSAVSGGSFLGREVHELAD